MTLDGVLFVDSSRSGRRQARTSPRTRALPGLFETTVEFVEEGSVFKPTCSSIQSMINQMTEAMISSVANVTRVLFLRPFTAHISGSILNAPDITNIVRASKHFNSICKAIDDKVLLRKRQQLSQAQHIFPTNCPRSLAHPAASSNTHIIFGLDQRRLCRSHQIRRRIRPGPAYL